MYLPEEVNLCSLVTAMTDSDTDDGVELEAQWELAPPADATDKTKLSHLTREQRRQLQKLLDEFQTSLMTCLDQQISIWTLVRANQLIRLPTDRD